MSDVRSPPRKLADTCHRGTRKTSKYKDVIASLDAAFAAGTQAGIEGALREVVRRTRAPKDRPIWTKDEADRLALHVTGLAGGLDSLRQRVLVALRASIAAELATARDVDADAASIRGAVRLLIGFYKAGWKECVEDLGDLFAGSVRDSPHAIALFGHCEKWAGNFERARDLFRDALSRPGCDASVHFHLAEVLDFLCDDAGALAEMDALFRHFSEEVLSISNPGGIALPAGPLLRQGNLPAAWAHFQRGYNRRSLETIPGPKLWHGEALANESLLLVAEKGLGDEIRYASCYGDLAARAPTLAIGSDPRLIPLLKRSFPDVSLIATEQAPAENWKRRHAEAAIFKLTPRLSLDLYCLAMQFDYVAMGADLPAYLRPARSAFPRHDGYLIADAGRRAAWRRRLEALGPGLKVGVSWRSSTRGYRREQHYFSLEQLLPILSVPGVHFVNLQYDECEEEIASFEQANGVAVHRWAGTDLKDDLDGVAALMKELDFVIAPHTMVKELAGAVGTPTLFMVPGGQSFIRWRADPETAEDIWYPSVVHIQSARVGNKDEVIRRTKVRLEEAATRHRNSEEWRPHSEGFHRSDLVDAGVELPAAADEPRDGRLAEEERRAKFRDVCAGLFRGTSQPVDPEGALFICGGNYKQAALTVLGAHGLLKRGWAVVPLTECPFDPGPVAGDLAYFRGLMVKGEARGLYGPRERRKGLRFDWEVDWPNQVCRAEGINFYGILANRLGKDYRRYSVDIEDRKVRARFETLLKTCDTALGVCLDMEERIAPLGLPMRITGFEPDYPPTGTFKLYCAERGYKHGIEFVEIRQAYEKYFQAGQLGLISAIEVQNVTRHRLYTSRCLRPDLFESWLEQSASEPGILDKARGWANQDRSGHGKPTQEGEITLERIRRHKAQGGKAVCLYGCVPYDFGYVWIDGGPAHRDLADWYNHTVSALNGTGTMLLVKPHPDEVKYDQFGRPEEFFVQMLKVRPERNVVPIGHRWLNNSDLLPYLDLGLTWRGTIAVELALMGKPVLVCGRGFKLGDAIDFPAPKDRADYEDILKHPEHAAISDDVRRRAAAVLAFYRGEVIVPYPFGRISAKRKLDGSPVLSEDALRSYLERGHPSVDEICGRIMS